MSLALCQKQNPLLTALYRCRPKPIFIFPAFGVHFIQSRFDSWNALTIKQPLPLVSSEPLLSAKLRNPGCIYSYSDCDSTIPHNYLLQCNTDESHAVLPPIVSVHLYYNSYRKPGVSPHVFIIFSNPLHCLS